MANVSNARALGGRVARGLLDGPFTGILPWIILGVFEGPGRVVWAAAVALGISVVFLVVDLARGRSLKILNVIDPIFFAGLLILTQLLGASQLDWLETWIGEISNIVLMVVALGSILFRVPFTIQYAREEVDEEYWHAPAFLRTNYMITGVWAAAFLVSAIAGFYGDAVLHDNNNVWTGWVIQVAAMLVAIQFTGWYSTVAKTRAAQVLGRPTDPPPPASALLAPLAGWLIPIGVLALALDAAPVWLGVALIVAGAGITRLLRTTDDTPADATRPAAAERPGSADRS